MSRFQYFKFGQFQFINLILFINMEQLDVDMFHYSNVYVYSQGLKSCRNFDRFVMALMSKLGAQAAMLV